MHEEAEQEQPVEVSPPSQQPILLTPTKQVSKDNHLLTTLHCSRQLVFVLTPTKQEPEMFSSLLSEEKSGMVEELGMSQSRQMHEQEGSQMQEELSEGQEVQEDVSDFDLMVVEEQQRPPEPVVQRSSTSIEIEAEGGRQQQESLTRNRTTQFKTAVRVCNCKRSNCLKKYCECYKAGQVCSTECECLSCNNTNLHKHQAQRPKSAARMSCNCKKSECSKNYCECHSSGQLCWEKCKCLECKNTPEGVSRMNMLAMLSKTTAKKRRRDEHEDD